MKGLVFTSIFLVALLVLFGLVDFRRPQISDPNLELVIFCDDEIPNLGTEGQRGRWEGKVKYRVSNRSDKGYSADKYFFRIVFSRAVDAPSIVIKEFSRNVPSHGEFSGEVLWAIDLPLPVGGNPAIYLNLYEESGNGEEPTLIAYAFFPLKFAK